MHPGAGQEAREGARAPRREPRKGGRQVPDPLRKFALGSCLCVAHVYTCTHTQTHTFTKLPVKQPNQGLNGTWRQKRTTLSQKTSRNSRQPQPGTQAAQESTRRHPRQAEKTTREGPPDSWAPQIPQASPNTPATPKEKSLPGCSCHICLGGRRHSGAAPDPRIPSQPASPGGRFSRWQPRVKHEDGTVPQGC